MPPAVEMIATTMTSAVRRTRAPLCLLQRSLCAAPDVVVVSIEDAKNKTAAALRMVGWDEEDAALQASEAFGTCTVCARHLHGMCTACALHVHCIYACRRRL